MRITRSRIERTISPPWHATEVTGDSYGPKREFYNPQKSPAAGRKFGNGVADQSLDESLTVGRYIDRLWQLIDFSFGAE